MTIKRDENYGIMMVALIAGMAILGYCSFSTMGLSLGTYIVFGIPASVFIRFLIVTGRTFILSSEGCTVCFLWWKKQYLWSELKTKRIENYRPFTLHIKRRYLCPYKKYAVFAPFHVRKPKWMGPDFYNMLHPFSYVYINFHIPDPEPTQKFMGISNGYLGRQYEAAESEFLKKMKLWQVALEEK